MLGTMHLGITDDGARADHEQAAQITVALFAYTAEPVLSPLECCLGTIPIQAEKKLRPDRKAFGSDTVATKAVASTGPTLGVSSSLMLISLNQLS
jgi:hypothetical protein